MAVYMVVAEDGEGMWLDEPNAFDSLAEARVDARRRLGRMEDSTVVIYSCQEKEALTAADLCKSPNTLGRRK